MESPASNRRRSFSTFPLLFICGASLLDLARSEVNSLRHSSSNHHCIAITGPIVKKKCGNDLTLIVTALCKKSDVRTTNEARVQ